MSDTPTTTDGKLGLTPQERRLVAGVGLIVFAVLNIWLVWPHFGDWRKIQAEREKAERTLASYKAEIQRLPSYQSRLRDLESLGSSIVAEEQDVDLATTVQIQSQISKLEITRNNDVRSGATTQTNQFFDEKIRSVGYRGETEQLVQFLSSLTSTNSMIRVRDMTIKPEPLNNPNRLSGDITLVASYQRKAPLKPAAAPATNAPAKKAEPPAKKAAVAPAKNPAASSSATNKPAGAQPKTSTPTKPKT